MALVAVKIPPTWKNNLVTLRDSLEEEQGTYIVEAIAVLSTTENGQELLEQLPALAEATRANPRSTLEAIAAVAEGEMPTSSAAPEGSTALLPPITVQGRAVPYALLGMVEEILELHRHNPEAARKVLQDAIAARVEPVAKAVEGVSFKITNEYLAADTFPWDNDRSIKIPVDQTMGPWPEAQVKRLEAAIAARPKTMPGGRPTAQGATVLVRV